MQFIRELFSDKDKLYPQLAFYVQAASSRAAACGKQQEDIADYEGVSDQ